MDLTWEMGNLYFLKMKKFVLDSAKKIAGALSPWKGLLFIALAFWVSHVFLRILLLFRSNPYGFPFVSKPDWYIFHAVCLDFMWIFDSLVVFVLLAFSFQVFRVKVLKREKPRSHRLSTALFAVFHSAVLLATLLDHEVLRFLGSHLSFGLVNTYKDTSSILMFWDYVANDLSVPFLQFFVLALILPATYGVYRLLRRVLLPHSMKVPVIALALFYAASYSFVYVIWTGNARMTKLRPVVSLVYNDLFFPKTAAALDSIQIVPFKDSYRKLWVEVEGDSLWAFPDSGLGKRLPTYRTPKDSLLKNKSFAERRRQKPNVILFFLESHRGWNVGFMNPGKPSPTPFLDSLAASSRAWVRMHSSGLPTTGGVLSTHLGIPHHSKLAEATDLAHVDLPSFASVLTDSGYATHYFSAADPAWDNLGVWMAKWYDAEHYDRHLEDDSAFFDATVSFLKDSLSHGNEPFLATVMSRSNHYPFNFAAGMTEEEKSLPLQERIQVTMRYTDRQLSRFIHSIEGEPWYENTYVVVMADHGFPLGENDVSTMNGGAFSNATWIPFLIHGRGVAPGLDTATCAQIDIAPTLLELLGFAVPNLFMGHNLLRGYGEGLSLGAYSKVADLGFDGFRVIDRYPLNSGSVDGLFAEGDMRQENNLLDENAETAKRLEAILDTLIRVSDYTLETGF